MRIRIVQTKKGFPAVWEAGGGYSNTGDATIVASSTGQPKKAIYVRGKGHLANAEHALIPVVVGDHLIMASHHRKDFTIIVYCIVDFEKEVDCYSDGKEFVKLYAIVEEKYIFDNGEWDNEVPEFLNEAIEVAKEKATCYHCREAHYIEI